MLKTGFRWNIKHIIETGSDQFKNLKFDHLVCPDQSIPSQLEVDRDLSVAWKHSIETAVFFFKFLDSERLVTGCITWYCMKIATILLLFPGPGSRCDFSLLILYKIIFMNIVLAVGYWFECHFKGNFLQPLVRSGLLPGAPHCPVTMHATLSWSESSARRCWLSL